jgi:nucleotide-binding universal stress UspA family protein
MNELPTPLPIVVGIDGSKAAMRAALWAVDEAVSRDVPVRLLYAIEEGITPEARREGAARKLASAETAVHRVVMAIEATGQPVKIETEIVQGPPIGSLIGASASAAMLCVGGSDYSTFDRPGWVPSLGLWPSRRSARWPSFARPTVNPDGRGIGSSSK